MVIDSTHARYLLWSYHVPLFAQEHDVIVLLTIWLLPHDERVNMEKCALPFDRRFRRRS